MTADTSTSTSEELEIADGPAGPANGPAKFYDSTRPALIPAGSRAALYRDGRFPAAAEIADRFSHVRWITIAAAFQSCGIADYEPGNPVFHVPTMLSAFANGRLSISCRARIYTDRVNAGRAWFQVGHLPNVVWWIATLDGRQRQAAELAHELAFDWDAPIPTERLWAQQWDPGQAYDTSVLYGAW